VANNNARFEFNKEDFLKQKFYLDIELSSKVHAQDLEKHFSIWFTKYKNGDIVEVPLLYNLKTDNPDSEGGVKKFSIVSDWIDRPASDRKIYYKITSGLSPVKGNLNLSDDYENYFKQEQLKYIDFNKIDWVFLDGKFKAVVSLNSPVELDILNKSLTIIDKLGHSIPNQANICSHKPSTLRSINIMCLFCFT